MFELLFRDHKVVILSKIAAIFLRKQLYVDTSYTSTVFVLGVLNEIKWL